jgi:ubiquinone/menaquinone biosynthesis C-methylase UbiE
MPSVGQKKLLPGINRDPGQIAIDPGLEPPYCGGQSPVSTTESKYIERRQPEVFGAGPAPSRREPVTPAREEEWRKALQEDFTRFVPFLTRRCGLEFRGRVLEIGAGDAWLSAELSKQPRVVEVIATDFSAQPLKEEAPKVFKLLGANTAKITRMPADFHQLEFPDNHFDFVVCATVLHHAANIVQVLREAKRVLKPGGKLVAIREPVWPLVKIKSRSKMLAKLVSTGVDEHFYTLADYREFFRQAALPLTVERVNLSRGLKYYVNKMVNGLTHARYAFIGTKNGGKPDLRKRP